MARQPRIVIIGAGFGGIAQAIELQRHGFTDITILEKAGALGAPGSITPTRVPRVTFTTTCTRSATPYDGTARGRVLHRRSRLPQRGGPSSWRRLIDHLRGRGDIVHLGGYRPAVDPDSGRWTQVELRCSCGRHWAVVPQAISDIPERGTFAGHQFHSAQWDHHYEPDGKRVAVVGTGASAVQFVPDIARRVSRLTMF